MGALIGAGAAHVEAKIAEQDQDQTAAPSAQSFGKNRRLQAAKSSAGG
jgi:hypothetical protein